MGRFPIKISEHQLQVAFFDWVRLKANSDERYQMIFSTPNQGGAGVKGMLRTIKMNLEGASRGFPDVSILVPNKGYHGYFIELKIKTGVLHASQVDWINRLNKVGYKAEYIKTDNWEDIKNLVEDYLDGK